ncbi:hypothetical protein [Thermococcus paralvinellae]|uniref:hypothetical protein n=1 Tax=Thermococcus paralvinellae TaxID=582419 RepID=UPI001D1002C2|nr:hypothetical protein [Thermococcus paralvinellae]
MGMPRGFGGPMIRGPIFGRRRWGFGWWWGFGIFGIFLLLFRLAFLLLPFILIGALIYLITKK